jgi:ABC-type transport system involved in multi-copper enzyme maturation permease subunit
MTAVAPAALSSHDRLESASARLLVGVAAHGVLAVLLLGVGLVAGLGNPAVLGVTSGLMPRLAGTPEQVWLAGLLSVSGAALGVLGIQIGVRARERWVVPWAGVLAVLALGALGAWGHLPALLTLAVLGWGVAPLLRSPTPLRTNPMTLKELRERMRGGRAFAVITVYVLLLCIFAVVLFAANAPITRGLATSVTGDLGRAMFAGIVGLELALMLFIAPAFTAGSVTGERERQTYDLLRMTLLPPASFLIGKLQAAFGFIVLLMLAAIPLQSIAFLFGGVSEVELVLSLVMLLVTGLTFSAVGLFFSAHTARTNAASTRAYLVAVLVMVGMPVLLGVLGAPFYNALSGQGTGMTGSPVWEAFLIYLGALLNSLSPFTAATASQTLLLAQGQAGLWSATLSTNGATLPLAAPWLTFCLVYLSVSAVLIALAVRRGQAT